MPDEPTDPPQPGTPTFVVRGEATAEEVAAVTAVLTAPVEKRPGRATAPPWLRAGLREGLGGRPAAEPSDLR